MRNYDVAIIGGGVIGCASAYFLAKAGVSVAIIERGQLNAGASGRNAGSLHFQLEHRLIHNETHLKAQLPHLIPLTLAAIEQWNTLEDELSCDIGLSMSGGVMVAETSEQIRLLERKAKLENRYGLAVELLSAEETLARAPYLGETVQAALYCREEGHCNPRLLTPAFARKAEALGADFFTDTAVMGLDKVGAGWNVSSRIRPGEKASERLEIRAEKVLNASGAWAHEIAAMANIHLPIFPVALMMSVTEPVPVFLKHMVQHVGRKLSLKQVEDGNLLIGGGWSARLQQHAGKWISNAPAKLSLDALKSNLGVASEIVPAVNQLHLLRTWTGITGVTADQLPIVGQVDQTPGFYVAAGGSGFTFGPLYARLLSEEILTGLPSEALQPYSPARFGHVNMYMGN
ncbi:FAD-binding oxidoreductase [Pseudomaricurvus alkylphenolicus]|uniref:NAD(P)/FAD-dependent oxidoreductase n=1 Tax=Pseudomaricurvus alkylphenolicus TaxID=1306991 RepID=UPI00141DF632|nr:FAD-dependent oxidoreductase [Pseudomaricurvus alkylphenolicus]NIB40301.1 FAD-binding oxidoreductase [Pseudomaricurvus alkylphenolicus]